MLDDITIDWPGGWGWVEEKTSWTRNYRTSWNFFLFLSSATSLQETVENLLQFQIQIKFSSVSSPELFLFHIPLRKILKGASDRCVDKDIRPHLEPLLFTYCCYGWLLVTVDTFLHIWWSTLVAKNYHNEAQVLVGCVIKWALGNPIMGTVSLLQMTLEHQFWCWWWGGWRGAVQNAWHSRDRMRRGREMSCVWFVSSAVQLVNVFCFNKQSRVYKETNEEVSKMGCIDMRMMGEKPVKDLDWWVDSKMIVVLGRVCCFIVSRGTFLEESNDKNERFFFIGIGKRGSRGSLE